MTKNQRSKRPHQPKPAAASTAGEHLEQLERIQDKLEKINVIQKQAIDARRQAVANAWNAGASAKELAQTLKISLAKVYTLLPR